jgi:CHAD domain-containing protein
MKRHIEREKKFDVAEGFQMPMLEQLDGAESLPVEEETYRTVYFDTDDLRLLERGVTLRHREREGWTLKLPSGGKGEDLVVRREIVVTGNDPQRLPPMALDLTSAFSRGGVLKPLARLRTTRRCVKVLRGPERAATIAHDRVAVLHGRRIVGRFEEVEIEVGPAGTPALMSRLNGVVRTAGAVPSQESSKLVRSLSLLHHDAPQRRTPSGDPDTRSIVQAAIMRSTDQLIRHDPGVRIGDDVEDVHQARVATRRLRSDLRSFATVLRSDRIDPIRMELRWLGEMLGAVRDLDVFLETLAREAAAWVDLTSDMGDLQREIHAQRRRAQNELLATMRSDRYVRLLNDVVELAAAPPLRRGRKLDPREVMQPGWERLTRAVSQAAPEATDADLHTIRIRLKRVRYSADALAPLVGRSAASFARSAGRFQDVLGTHHDAVVAIEYLDRFAGRSRPRASFVAGVLAARSALHRDEAKAAWRSSWRALSKPKRRFW